MDGRAFREEGRALEVNRNGALTGNAILAPQEEILIRRERTGKEARAQVVVQVRKRTDGFVYVLGAFFARCAASKSAWAAHGSRTAGSIISFFNAGPAGDVTGSSVATGPARSRRRRRFDRLCS